MDKSCKVQSGKLTFALDKCLIIHRIEEIVVHEVCTSKSLIVSVVYFLFSTLKRDIWKDYTCKSKRFKTFFD